MIRWNDEKSIKIWTNKQSTCNRYIYKNHNSSSQLWGVLTQAIDYGFVFVHPFHYRCVCICLRRRVTLKRQEASCLNPLKCYSSEKEIVRFRLIWSQKKKILAYFFIRRFFNNESQIWCVDLMEWNTKKISIHAISKCHLKCTNFSLFIGRPW